MRSRDRLVDAFTEMRGAWGRTLLLMTAVGLSTGTLLSSMGLAQTASQQVATTIAAEVTSRLTVLSSGSVDSDQLLFPPTSVERVESLERVEAVGLRVGLEAATARVHRGAIQPDPGVVRVIGATTGYLDVAGIEITPSTRRLFDNTMLAPVILGHDAAAALGVPESVEWQGFDIVVAGAHFSVVGVLPPVDDEDDSLVIVPYGWACEVLGSDATAGLHVRTSPGAGARVADVVRFAIDPYHSERFQVTQVADLRDVRRGVDNDLGRMVGVLAISLVILSGLLIANTMVVSVVNRSAEIGLRRALGMSTLDIMRMVYLEGGVVGAMGGVLGSAAGAWGTAITSLVNGWQPVLHWWFLAAGPALGLAIGAVAGTYPAVRAARIRPALAIRME